MIYYTFSFLKNEFYDNGNEINVSNEQRRQSAHKEEEVRSEAGVRGNLPQSRHSKLGQPAGSRVASSTSSPCNLPDSPVQPVLSSGIQTDTF